MISPSKKSPEAFTRLVLSVVLPNRKLPELWTKFVLEVPLAELALISVKLAAPEAELDLISVRLKFPDEEFVLISVKKKSPEDWGREDPPADAMPEITRPLAELALISERK